MGKGRRCSYRFIIKILFVVVYKLHKRSKKKTCVVQYKTNAILGEGTSPILPSHLDLIKRGWTWASIHSLNFHQIKQEPNPSTNSIGLVFIESDDSLERVGVAHGFSSSEFCWKRFSVVEHFFLLVFIPENKVGFGFLYIRPTCSQTCTETSL